MTYVDLSGQDLVSGQLYQDELGGGYYLKTEVSAYHRLCKVAVIDIFSGQILLAWGLRLKPISWQEVMW